MPQPGHEPWWKGAVLYQIYPRSFCDRSGDGIGDLAGIEAHLDHLSRLGVDGLWLSPIFPSPMADFGYDVSDYRDIDPVFGSLAGFDALVAAAHARGLKVIVDWVVNHTSDRHPWFEEARASRTSAKRDWYVWRDAKPDGSLPNNWVSCFTGAKPAWTWDDTSGQYYLHSFLPQQPDLNWANPEVQEAMHDVARFWLDRGVDGFRIDAVHLIGHDDELTDDPAHHVAAGVPHSSVHDHPATHEHLRGIRQVVDSYPGDRVTVGEVFILSTRRVAPYYGDNDELHLCFNFPPLFAPWDAGAWRERVDKTVSYFDPIGAWPTWVLSNHDQPRHRTRYGGSEARARAAAVLLLGLRGTPFLYAGEELGLEDAFIPADRVVDPGGRDGCRAPIPWEGPPAHGWMGADPWLPWPPEADLRNVAAMDGDPASILGLYRRLLSARRDSVALRNGAFAWAKAPDEVLAWTRSADAEEVTVLVNFSDQPQKTSHRGTVWVGTSDIEPGRSFTGTLAGDEALILRG